MSRSGYVTLAACTVLFASAALWAQDHGQKPKQDAGKAKQEGAGQPAFTPEQMAAWEKAKAVTENHKLLNDYMVGNWEYTNKMWMEPGADAMEAKGTCETKNLFDRFTQSTHKGDFMGEQFTGIATTGYDNMKKKFVATWIDNMGTAIMFFEGTYDPGTKSFTYTSTMDCPIEQSPVKIREVIRVVDKNKHILEWYETRAGKEMKTMEITYTRKG